MSLKINRNILSNLIYYLLVAISFSFPFGREVTSRLLIAFFVIVFILLLDGRMRHIVIGADKTEIFYLALPTSYFALCVIGLLYTSNMGEGLFELDKKITMLAFPVAFWIIRGELNKVRRDNILKGYLAGITLCGVVSICLGLYNSTNIVDGEIVFRTAVNDIAYERGYSFFQQATQGGNYFFGTYISPFIKYNYYGWYLSVGCLIAVHFGLRSHKKFLYLAACIFLFCMLILSDARGPLLSFLVSMLFVVTLAVRNKAAKVFFPFLLIFILTILFISPRTSLLFADLKHSFTNVNYDSHESTELRLFVWYSAFQILKDNWLTGVGTGDRENTMLEMMKDKNKLAFEMKLNAHNQYLEATIMFGVIGLCTLIVLIGAPLKRGLEGHHYIFSTFLLIMALNMLFESILQVFQGIVFYTFFYCLFIIDSNLKPTMRHEDITSR